MDDISLKAVVGLSLYFSLVIVTALSIYYLEKDYIYPLRQIKIIGALPVDRPLPGVNIGDPGDYHLYV